MESVWIILLGSFALSVVHAAIPNHWLPLVLLGKTEQWSNRQLAAFSAVTGLAHTLSTVFIGILVGALGVQLSRVYSFIEGIA